MVLTCPSSRAVELRPDLSCLWKLLGDACTTTVGAVSPNRAQVVMPGPLAGLEPTTQSHSLNQAQTLRVGERYDPRQAYFIGLNHAYLDCVDILIVNVKSVCVLFFFQFE